MSALGRGRVQGLGEGQARPGLRLRGGPRWASRPGKPGTCSPPRVRPAGLPAARSAGLCSPDRASGSRDLPAASVQALGWGGSTAGSRGGWAGGGSPGPRSSPILLSEADLSLPDSQVWGARALTHRREGRQGLGGLCDGHRPDDRPGASLGDMERGTWALLRLKRPARNAAGLLGDVQSKDNIADAYGLFFWANVEMQNFSLSRSSSES